MLATFCRCAALSVALLAAPLAALAQTPAPPAPPAKPTLAGLAEQVAALRAELEQLKEAAAQVPTLAQAIKDIDGRLAVLEQDLAQLRRQREAIPDAVAAIDDLSARLTALEQDVRALRTSVAGLERDGAGAGGGGGGAVYKGGFELATADGLYTINLNGYAQVRYEAGLASGFDDIEDSGFELRRARIGLKGRLGGDALTYKVLFDTVKSPSAHDYYLDYEVMPELVIRAGQYKNQFTRSFITSSSKLIFPERSAAIEGLRYDRDVQVGVHGELVDGKVSYYAGLSNGAGRAKTNDNIDLNPVVRVEVALLGTVFEPASGDIKGSEEPALVIGAGFVHDLVALPGTLAGIELENDVDGDGDIDNVRVVSFGVDAAFRYQGFALEADFILRRESYGTILDSNPELDAALDAIVSGDATRTYEAIVAQASYMVMPRRLLVGARYGQSRRAVLGVDGRHATALPAGPRLMEFDGLVQLYDDAFGGRALGLQYTYFNYSGGGPSSHRVILETQLRF